MTTALAPAKTISTVAELRDELADSEWREMSLPLLSTDKLREYRSGTSGGYIKRPADIHELIEINLAAASAMRQVATVVRTNTGRKVASVVIDDDGAEGVIAEPGATVTVADMQFGRREGHGVKLRSGGAIVPVELLEDGIGVAEAIVAALVRRVARAGNRYFTTGTGHNQPWGVLNMATVGKTAAAVDAVTVAELHDLIGSLSDEYRGNAQLMANPAVFAALRKIGDGTVFEAAGLGFPARIYNNAMPSALTAGARVLAYGDFSSYRIIDIGDLRLVRTDEELAEHDQVRLEVIGRVDGWLVDSQAVKVLAMAAS